MPFISITRLRIRSLRFLPAFFLHTQRSLTQLRRAEGFQRGALLADRRWTFWTMTAWTDEAAMRAYMLGGAHGAVMPALIEWSDEASVVHWTQESHESLSWTEADRRMREEGRPSKIRHPGRDHAGLTFPKPRLSISGPIHARR